MMLLGPRPSSKMKGCAFRSASCAARSTAGIISSRECACWQPPGRLREWQFAPPGHSLNFLPAIKPSSASAWQSHMGCSTLSSAGPKRSKSSEAGSSANAASKKRRFAPSKP